MPILVDIIDVQAAADPAHPGIAEKIDRDTAAS